MGERAPGGKVCGEGMRIGEESFKVGEVEGENVVRGASR